jgi:hypothetical protein
MDFGARPALNGKGAPVTDVTLRLAWFERSSAEHGSAAEGRLADGSGVLDRFREADGLVYNGEGDYEL